LDPSARIEVDKANNALIVYAPLADHVTIRAVIDRLDGSGRRFEVIQLRRLPADYVAGTIDFMMGGQREAESVSPAWLPPWERDRQKQPKRNPNEFRVDADVENNRLLLWANEVEIQEVQNLLVKLGEVPSGESAGDRVRILEGLSPEEAAGVLESLQRQWPSVAPNPIRIEKVPEQSSPPPPDQPDDSKPQPPSADQPVDLQRRAEAKIKVLALPAQPSPATNARIETRAMLAIVEQPPAPKSAPPHQEEQSAPAAPPPLVVTQSPDGKILITCQDPRALEIVDSLLRDILPTRQDYRIFRLR